ncbi:hypothetical protein H6G64_12990 [Calothrix sp. FACHB-156]|nr:hypothetical protein [Calothrix sp. FACHB-156]
MSTFLSGVAVFLSTVALLCGGYAAYEVFTLRQTLNTTSTSTQTNTASPISTKQPVPSEPETTVSPSPSTETTPSPAATSTNAIKAGQFVQPAFGNKAEVEILSAKRIKDPETANRDVINLQMRIRRQATDNVGDGDVISVASTTARNPDTSETYKGVSANRSTGSVSLAQLRPKASADAYVWIRVPDGVKSVDLFVPDTAAFKNVPISN